MYCRSGHLAILALHLVMTGEPSGSVPVARDPEANGCIHVVQIASESLISLDPPRLWESKVVTGGTVENVPQDQSFHSCFRVCRYHV